VPSGLTAGNVLARFRLTETPGYSYTGLAPNGEVEDQMLNVTPVSTPASIWIDGNFGDWDAALAYTDPVDDQHDTDHDQAGDTPAYVDHPDVDLLTYKVSHDEENFYFYFQATGEIGRTQLEDAANNLRAGRYYVIVTIDIDDDDVTGYPLYEGGYYTDTTDTTGYDANGELEFYNGAFNTGHFLQHGALNETELEQAFADQSNGQYVYGGPETQGPFMPGFVNVLPGSYDYYTQWVYMENDPGLFFNDSVTFVQDKGPIVIGNISYALSTDGDQLEVKVPFKGFLEDAEGNPILEIGKTVDLSFSLEASGELSNEVSAQNPNGLWASDTAEPIISYYLSPLPQNPIIDDGDASFASTTSRSPTLLTGAHQDDSLNAPSDDGSALGSVLVNQEVGPDDFVTDGSDWANLMTVSISGTELVVELTDDAVLIQPATPSTAPDALAAYVNAPDTSYDYTSLSWFTRTGYTAYALDMTSQTFREATEVDQPVWQHSVTLYVPDTLAFKTAVLFVTSTEMVTVHLRTVPSEPLTFSDEGFPRGEDEIFAYTFDKYLQTGGEFRPLFSNHFGCFRINGREW